MSEIDVSQFPSVEIVKKQKTNQGETIMARMKRMAFCFTMALVWLACITGCGDGPSIGDGIARATIPDPEISITMHESLWYGSWMQLHNRSNSRMVTHVQVTSADGKNSKTVAFGIPPNGTADADISTMGSSFVSGESGSIRVEGFRKKLYFKLEGAQYRTWFDF